MAKCTKCGEENNDWIPTDRLSAKTQEAKQARKDHAEAEARITALESELASAKKQAGQVETLTAQLAEWQGRSDAWDTERAVMVSGITDREGVEIVSLLYQRLEEKPKGGIGEWLRNRDALPKAAQAYLPSADGGEAKPAAPAATEAAPAEAPPQAPRRQSQGNEGARPYTDAPAGFAPGAVSAMDPKTYAANRDAIWGGRAPAHPTGIRRSES